MRLNRDPSGRLGAIGPARFSSLSLLALLALLPGLLLSFLSPVGEAGAIFSGERLLRLGTAAAPGQVGSLREGGGNAAPPPTVTLGGTLRVACDTAYPPYSFRDESGRLVGIVPDLWREWSRRTGVPVRLFALPWSEAMEAVEGGRADVLEVCFRSPERERRFAFTAPYAEVPAAIFFDRDLRGLSANARSLEGFAVGVVEGDYSETYLYAHRILSIRSYPSFDEVIRAFARGEIKVFLMDEPPAFYYLYKAGLQSRIRKTEPLYRGQLHRAVLRDRADLIPRIEEGFRAIDPSVRERIFLDWEGRQHASLPRGFLPLLLFLSAAGLVLFSAALFWNRALRLRVAEATRELQTALAEREEALSAREEALRHLAESEARYERALRGADDAIFEYDPVEGKRYNSPRWAELLGVDPEALPRDEEAFEAFVFPEDRPRRRKAFEDLIEGRTETLKLEYRVRRPDGSIRWLRARGSAVRDARGHVLRISGSATDITAVKSEESEKELLYEIADLALSAQDREDLFRRLHPLLRRHIPAKNLYVALLDPETDRIVFPYFSDEMEKSTPEPYPPGKGLTEYVLRTGDPLLATPEKVAGLAECGLVEPRGPEAVDWLGVPLFFEGAPRGVLAVQSYDPGTRYSEEDERILSFAGAQIGLAIEKKIVEERLSWSSFHDAVTGLYNRAFFEEELNRLDVPRNLPLSLIMGDVNGLKLVNDGFGHLTGDALLKKTAEALREACRRDDLIARWGGDEFTLLLPRTGEEEANAVMERIRERVSRIRDLPVRPSIALGCAQKRAPEEDVRSVLREAEERMYRSKTLDDDRSREALMESLQEALWARAPHLRGHAERVRRLTEGIARALGLEETEVALAGLAARLHDIGKASLPDELLASGDPLREEAREAVERHAEIGYRIARATPAFAPAAEAILAHHERYDGGGYPKGLSGEEIPLIARILAAANGCDRRLHPPRGPGETPGEAMAALRAEAGGAYDPRVLEALERVLEEMEGNGEKAEDPPGQADPVARR